MKKYKVTLDGGFWIDSEVVLEATHYSEGSNMVYFYDVKENITIDNVVAAFGAARILFIKEVL